MPAIPSSFDDRVLLELLKSLLDALPDAGFNTAGLSAARRRTLRAQIERAIDALQRTLEALDPIKLPPHILDPSDPAVVGRLIADTLLAQERHALRSVQKFYGSGVYAIYFSGSFDAYENITRTDHPIYIGKADLAEHGAMTPVTQGTRLWGRLNDHRKSIDTAINLDLNEFDCRYLVVRSAWQGTAETYLIDRFMPIWNNEARICYGFGKHGDDPATRANTRSPWDTLHPGRHWATRADNIPYQFSADQIKEQIVAHLQRYSPNAYKAQ